MKNLYKLKYNGQGDRRNGYSNAYEYGIIMVAANTLEDAMKKAATAMPTNELKDTWKIELEQIYSIDEAVVIDMIGT